MTRDDIIRMAQEACAMPSGDPREWDVWLFQGPAMERFAALVAAHEREACARACEDATSGPKTLALVGIGFAELIRARGET